VVTHICLPVSTLYSETILHFELQQCWGLQLTFTFDIRLFIFYHRRVYRGAAARNRGKRTGTMTIDAVKGCRTASSTTFARRTKRWRREARREIGVRVYGAYRRGLHCVGAFS
jgi:hypothetical protein